MPEEIYLKQKLAVITLADTSDLEAAARKLNITAAELESSIKDLESLLCLELFDWAQSAPTLTEEGRYLVAAFREMTGR